MLRSTNLLATAAVFVFAMQSAAFAQTPAPTFEKKNYNYSEWTKGRFSEVVTVTGPGKMIFVAGIGAEDEKGETSTNSPGPA